MSLSSVAGDVIFSAGWIFIGAAALFSRHKKTSELAERTRCDAVRAPDREYHRGLYFDSGFYCEDMGVPAERQPATRASAAVADPVGPAWASDLGALAQVIENAVPEHEMIEEERH